MDVPIRANRKRNERHSQPCASVADDDRLILERHRQELREGPAPVESDLDVAPCPTVDASEHVHLRAGGHPRHQRKAGIRPRAQVDRLRRECRLRPGHRGQQHRHSNQRAPKRACAFRGVLHGVHPPQGFSSFQRRRQVFSLRRVRWSHVKMACPSRVRVLARRRRGRRMAWAADFVLARRLSQVIDTRLRRTKATLIYRRTEIVGPFSSSSGTPNRRAWSDTSESRSTTRWRSPSKQRCRRSPPDHDRQIRRSWSGHFQSSDHPENRHANNKFQSTAGIGRRPFEGPRSGPALNFRSRP